MQVTEVMLQKAIHDYKKRHPNATDDQIIANMVKHKVPASVAGSPQWHGKHLADLLAMVDRWGMPHFFLTLTAGDRDKNGTQWSQMTDLDTFLHRWCSSFTWQDAPVESAHIFKARLTRFMRKFLPRNKPGLLGRVRHTVKRLEVQGRSSCEITAAPP
jgi:hypothetical protein